MPNVTSQTRVLVTGGAGFIGSHVVDRLVADGAQVTVLDNLSSGHLHWIQRHVDNNAIRFVQGDLLDLDTVVEAVRGQDFVWHLGANTDIPSGVTETRLDLDHCVVATWNVLEAMRRAHVRDLLFASSGTVYGELPEPAMTERSGPLLPISLYGAGKLACEAFIAGYANLFGLHGYVFRFGNVIGARMGHGVIHDFIEKLRNNPTQLEILGDGTQEKNYFLVEDCIGGMLYAYEHATIDQEHPVEVFNLGAQTSTKVTTIARIVMEEMSLPNTTIRIAGGKRGWPGDQPRVAMRFDKIAELGWTASHLSDDAVRIAVQRMLVDG